MWRSRVMIKNVYLALTIILMKIRAVISGSSVHDVGYRVFLLNKALSEGLEGFSATNSQGPDDIPRVIVLAEGDEEGISDFSEYIKVYFPSHAMVDSIIIEPYERRVIRILDYMHLVQVEQLDKGIPAILSIKSSQEQMLEKQDRMLEKQDRMLDKQDSMLTKQDSFLEKQDRILEKQDRMLDKQDSLLTKQDGMLGKQDAIVTEIRALRTDLKTEMNERFNKLEHELQMVKDALHRSGIMA